MKKSVAFILILISLASPVRAGMIMEYDAMDKATLQKRQFELDMSRDFDKLAKETARPTEKSGSSWWKWTLGLVVVGGLAAAASAGGGKSGGGSSSGETGTITGTW